MHRNTVINKLEYIKNATGLNIQNFHDALCMYWLITIK
jgi:DNA-binding PucR family transcriptional regulator